MPNKINFYIEKKRKDHKNNLDPYISDTMLNRIQYFKLLNKKLNYSNLSELAVRAVIQEIKNDPWLYYYTSDLNLATSLAMEIAKSDRELEKI